MRSRRCVCVSKLGVLSNELARRSVCMSMQAVLSAINQSISQSIFYFMSVHIEVILDNNNKIILH